MKGIRFYADLVGMLPSRTTVKQLRERAKRGEHINCVALLLGDEHKCHDFSQEALVATFEHADSDTSFGAVSRDYLRQCRRIPESLARALHPRLAQRLDASE